MKKLILVISLFVHGIAVAQTQQQWAQLVSWDGVSYFSKYIFFNAGHMGPNALTVPFIGNGSIDSITSAGIAGQFHFSKGDKTQNINVYGNFCVAKNVSIDLCWTPVEFFSMSDTIKRERHVYYKNYYDKQAKGDVLLHTNINLLSKWRQKIQLALRIGVRLPSSSYKGVAAARFVDATGYSVDISMGKPLSPALKWVAMAGLYVWQMDKDDLRQNDAFLFGSGLEWNKNGWKLQPNISGYLGYQAKSGDKPIVFRINAEKRFSKTTLLLRFQQGLNDFKYSSGEVGIRRLFHN
jgi:hypothetical protein